jgi:hypothetical protein
MELWQMTLNEYRQSLKGQRVDRGEKGFRYYNREGQIQANHRNAIELALQLGRAIPPEVLKGYPHITKH